DCLEIEIFFILPGRECPLAPARGELPAPESVEVGQQAVQWTEHGLLAGIGPGGRRKVRGPIGVLGIEWIHGRPPGKSVQGVSLAIVRASPVGLSPIMKKTGP